MSLFAAGGAADTITGSRDRDFIFGGAGNDVLRGADGDDLLAGGDGDDRLSGGEGRDHLAGGAGRDVVFYEELGSGSVHLALRTSAEPTPAGEVIIELDQGAGAIDRMIGIERVELTDNSDRLTLATPLVPLSYGAIKPNPLVIDGIDQPSGADADGRLGDVLDFSTSTEKILLGRGADGDGAEFFTSWVPSQSIVRWFLKMLVPWGVAANGFDRTTGIKVANFEHVIGSSFSDTLGLADLNPGHGMPTAAEIAALDALTPPQVTLGASPQAIFDAHESYIADIAAVGVDSGYLVVEGGAGNDDIMGRRFASGTFARQDAVGAVF